MQDSEAERGTKRLLLSMALQDMMETCTPATPICSRGELPSNRAGSILRGRGKWTLGLTPSAVLGFASFGPPREAAVPVPWPHVSELSFVARPLPPPACKKFAPQ